LSQSVHLGNTIGMKNRQMEPQFIDKLTDSHCTNVTQTRRNKYTGDALVFIIVNMNLNLPYLKSFIDK
jgi:hypothetical protein